MPLRLVLALLLLPLGAGAFAQTPVAAEALAGLRPVVRPERVLAAPETISTRPVARDFYIPAARWDGLPNGRLWTRAMMQALESHGAGVTRTVPADIAEWCPGYAGADVEQRRAFWVGLMSGVAWYESTHRPRAVGAGTYHGLLQILPQTARWVGCRADSGQELQSGPANLSCAVRILDMVVPRDGAVAAFRGRWRGAANQWGPLTRAGVRERLAAWTRQQEYCQLQPLSRAPRPPARPARFVTVAQPR